VDDRRERQQWLEQLRDRFLGVARRRVPEDSVEDLVQDALSVVVAKGERKPDLAWCFQVLRNVIGNHYQKARTRARELHPDDVAPAAPSPTPLEALEDREFEELVEAGLGELANGGTDCERYLRALLNGGSPAAIAERERLDPAVLYRRIYRCRGKLRSILREKGVLA